MVRKPNARSKTAPRARRRALDRRRSILRAAARAFRRHGLATAGMREIAEEADLSPANLYYYFSSKDEILAFCQESTLDRLLEAVREARSHRGSPERALRHVIEAHVRCLLDEVDGAAAHLEVDALPPDLRHRIVVKRDAYERALRGIVRAGVRARAFVRCDAALVARAILGALNWTAQWYRPGGGMAPRAIASAFSGYLVRGLLA